jgi:hypothetical protein
MPRQGRNPCSGWGRSCKIISHNILTDDPPPGFIEQAFHRPVAVAAMAGRHVVVDGGVMAVA